MQFGDAQGLLCSELRKALDLGVAGLYGTAISRSHWLSTAAVIIR
jgi:hypothetical protein